MGLEKKYLRAIFGAAREHGVSYEELHDAIEAGFGKKSLKDLTKAEALRLIQGVRGSYLSPSFTPGRRWGMGNHGRKDSERTGEVDYLVNQREMELLREAAALRGWDERQLAAFIRRQTGREQIRTMREFNKVFWALKAMNRREGLHV